MKNPESQAVEKEVKNQYPVSIEICKNVNFNKMYTFNMQLQLKTQKKYKAVSGSMLEENPSFSHGKALIVFCSDGNHR